MAEENLGLDLASQTGQTNIVEAINGLKNLLSRLSDLLTLGSKTITQNGTYDPDDDSLDGYSSLVVNVPNTYTASDEGKVLSNGELVAQSSQTVTQNGTYDTTLKDEVIVDIPSDGIPTMSNDDWNALSGNEKQTYNLVALLSNNSGYVRGTVVNGRDYRWLNKYIPYSDNLKVICSALATDYIANDLTWGIGNNPVILNGPAIQNDDDSISLLGLSNGAWGSVDLGSVSKPFTAYIVCKLLSSNTSNYSRIISAFDARSSGNGIMLYGKNVNVSSWANDTSTNIDGQNNYFIGFIQFISSGNAKGGVLDDLLTEPVIVSKPSNTVGRYITIGRTDLNSSTFNAEPSDLSIKYIAVVDDADSPEAIVNNMKALRDHFLASPNS